MNQSVKTVIYPVNDLPRAKRGNVIHRRTFGNRLIS